MHEVSCSSSLLLILIVGMFLKTAIVLKFVDILIQLNDMEQANSKLMDKTPKTHGINIFSQQTE